MKFHVQKNLLVEALQKLASIISSRTTLPILNNVLIKTEGDFLTLVTTDLDLRITTKIPVVIEEHGATTVPVKRFLVCVRDFKDDKITIKTDNNSNLKIESDAHDAHYELLATSPDDFPQAPVISPSRKIVMTQADFFRHLNLVSYAVSNEESRKVLNGVLLSVKSNIFISVATDGRRLALMEKAIDNFEGKDGDIVIHSRVANELQRIMSKSGNITIEIADKIVRFTMDDTILISKILEGNFPNYRQVIPTSFSKKIEINREIFYSALRRIINVISESNPFISLSFSQDKLTIMSNNAEIGAGKEVLPVKYSGSEISLLLNPINLCDPLKVMTVDNFVFQMNDGYSPISLIGDEGFLYIMMPYRNK